MGERVFITEVGLRDGLQNQPVPVSTQDKLRLANALIAAGVRRLEAVSFVHPKIVPQMADAVEVLAGLPKVDALNVTALVPNMKGYERAREQGLKRVAVVVSTTDTFNLRNLNMTTAQTMEASLSVIRQARQDGLSARAYISGALACPYDGPTPVDVVHRMAEQLINGGADEISVADTIGAGNPRQIKDILRPLVAQYGAEAFNLHLHDTRGMALAMAWAGIECGVRKFDSSVGGLGGCPFAPGASGNVATEDLVYMLEASGFDSGISLEGLREAVAIAEQATQKTLGGRILTWMRSQDALKAAKAQPCAS
ncbi:Hydroxymethylglutaryl-CoA lyase [gamma proteobacterium HdN1]|nr:Hydroxymethylglutaryl-CoA lyase [gamma proteobacterium HdN1]